MSGIMSTSEGTKVVTPNEIKLPFDGMCVVCGRVIPAGSTALFFKHTGLIHQDCKGGISPSGKLLRP